MRATSYRAGCPLCGHAFRATAVVSMSNRSGSLPWSVVLPTCPACLYTRPDFSNVTFARNDVDEARRTTFSPEFLAGIDPDGLRALRREVERATRTRWLRLRDGRTIPAAMARVEAGRAFVFFEHDGETVPIPEAEVDGPAEPVAETDEGPLPPEQQRSADVARLMIGVRSAWLFGEGEDAAEWSLALATLEPERAVERCAEARALLRWHYDRQGASPRAAFCLAEMGRRGEDAMTNSLARNRCARLLGAQPWATPQVIEAIHHSGRVPASQTVPWPTLPEPFGSQPPFWWSREDLWTGYQLRDVAAAIERFSATAALRVQQAGEKSSDFYPWCRELSRLVDEALGMHFVAAIDFSVMQAAQETLDAAARTKQAGRVLTPDEPAQRLVARIRSAEPELQELVRWMKGNGHDAVQRLIRVVEVFEKSMGHRLRRPPPAPAPAPRPETILGPDREELLAKEPAAFPDFLATLWDRQGQHETPDLERLMGAGQAARLKAVPGVQNQLVGWLAAHFDARGVDTASCFLMGYWPGQKAFDPRLADALTQAIERPDFPRGVWASAVMALVYAFAGVDPARQARIRQACAHVDSQIRSGHGWAVAAALDTIQRPPAPS